MKNSKAQLLQNGVSIASVDGQSSGSNVYRFSGRLDRPLLHKDVQAALVTQVSVAVREGEVIVRLRYSDISEDVWKVVPNAPLLVPSSSLKPLDSVRVTASRDGVELDAPDDKNIAIVEVLIEKGTAEINPQDDGPFLILNAGKGVEFDRYTGDVSSWRDVRPESGAPGEWTSLSAGSSDTELISSDPSFNGEPSLISRDNENHLGFIYGTDVNTFAFMNGSQPFTLMMTCYPRDDGFNKRTFGFQGAFGAGIEGGFRPTSLFEANLSAAPWQGTTNTVVTEGNGLSGDGKGTLFQSEELAEKPSVIIYDYTTFGSTGTMRVYYQGRWQTLAASFDRPSSTSASNPLVCLGNNLADLRLYDRSATDEEIGQYINGVAGSVYGIDNTKELGNPYVTGAGIFQRMSRGLSPFNIPLPNQTVEESADTRIERTITPAIAEAYNFPTSDDPSAVPPLDSLERRVYPTVDEDGIRTNPRTCFNYPLSPSANFEYLNGEGGLSISIVFRYRGPNSSSDSTSVLFASANYRLGNTGGTNIFIDTRNQIYVETENADTSEVVLFNRAPVLNPSDFEVKLNTLYSLTFRINANTGSYNVDLLNVDTSVNYSSTASVTNPPSGNVSVSPSFGGRIGTNPAQYSADATFYEISLQNSFINLEEYQAYVTKRYS